MTCLPESKSNRAYEISKGVNGQQCLWGERERGKEKKEGEEEEGRENLFLTPEPPKIYLSLSLSALHAGILLI